MSYTVLTHTFVWPPRSEGGEASRAPRTLLSETPPDAQGFLPDGARTELAGGVGAPPVRGGDLQGPIGEGGNPRGLHLPHVPVPTAPGGRQPGTGGAGGRLGAPVTPAPAVLCRRVRLRRVQPAAFSASRLRSLWNARAPAPRPRPRPPCGPGCITELSGALVYLICETRPSARIC